VTTPPRRPHHAPLPALLPAVLAAALLAALATAPAAAQEPAPLFVAFDFGDYPGHAGLFDAAAAAGIAADLAAAAGRQGRLPYWRFAAAGVGDYPRLAVRVEKQRQTSDYELVATLHLGAGDAGHGSWHGSFITFQELVEEDGFPAPSRVPGRLLETFVETVLTGPRVTPDGGDMFERLTELVPIGVRAHLEKGAPSGMLGLDRSRYGALALSTFRLLCEKENGAVVALYSKGTGERRQFPDPPFPAIVVLHDRWQEGTETAQISADQLALLDALSTSRIFLEEFDPAGLAFAGAGGDDDLPPPSLATVENRP